MTLRTGVIKGLALTCALAVHGAALMSFAVDDTVQIESNAGAAQARFGSSFEDMAAGTLSAQETEEIAKETETEEVIEEVEPTPAELVKQFDEPTKPEPVAAAKPSEPDLQLPQTQPSQVKTPKVTPAASLPLAQPTKPIAPDALALTANEISKAEKPATAEHLQKATEVEATVPKTAVSTSEVIEPETSTAPKAPVSTAEAVEPEKAPVTETPQRVVEPATPTETVKAEDPPEPPKKTKKKTAKKKKKKKKKAAPRGNARQNNTQGSATGSNKAKAKRQGVQGGTSGGSGNAAASNYPGKVMRKIARVPRPRSTFRGSVLVAFKVSSSGQIAALSVARSSGNANLDKLALRVIRKAAPFPKPPAGARRSFTVTIKGR